MFARCYERKVVVMSVSMMSASFHGCVNKKKVIFGSKMKFVTNAA